MDNEEVTMSVEETVTETEAVEVDWKEKAEKLEVQVNNLNKALHETRRKPASDIDTVIETKMREIEERRIQDDIDEIARSVAGDDVEKALEVYKNSLKPSGYSRAAIERDMQAALLLANKDKLLAETEKKARKSIAEKKSMEMASVSLNSAPEESGEELSDTERSFINQMAKYARK